MSRNIPCAALIAAGITAALCAILAGAIALAPPGSDSILGDFLPIEISGLPRTITHGQLFALSAGLTVGAGLLGAVIAWLAAACPTWIRLHPAAGGPAHPIQRI